VRRIGALTALLFLLASCEPTPVAVRPAPASEDLRIVTLAPHLAELLFDIGAGETLVGVSSFTDYPEEALRLPVVSDAFITDRELLAVLQPNLLLAWESGTPVHVIDNLRAAGFRVEVIRTRSLADVADALEQLGGITNHLATARRLADEFRDGIARRRSNYATSQPVRIFFQVSMHPLYTINAGHYIGELISVCGGQNIFADLVDLAPMVGVEAVIERNPEALLAGDTGQADTFDEWQRWPHLAANLYGNHFLLPAAELGRPTPRLLQAADAICAALEVARANRERYQKNG
jgi:iron complex transport system substrate-binding protein